MALGPDSESLVSQSVEMRLSVLPMLVLAMIGLTAGCSGDDNAGEMSTTATSTTTPEQGAKSFCAAREEFQQKVLALGPPPEMDPPMSDADRRAFESYNAKVKKLSQDLRAEAPEEIREVVDAIDPSDDSPDAKQREAIRVYGDWVTRECEDGLTP